MRTARPTPTALVVVATAALIACVEPLTVEEPDSTPLSVGETRTVELRYLRLDVRDFEQTLTRADLLALPPAVARRLWLFDLDLSTGPAAPRLIDNALSEIAALPPGDLDPASRNMQRLLAMTPEDADLRGTVLEPMGDLGAVVGLSAAQVLADMMGREVDESFLPVEVISTAVVEHVIRSHPAAQTRPGPLTVAHPDGVYPVAPGSIPVTLADAANDFSNLSETFGPVFVDGVLHPGFVVGQTRSEVLTDDFRMTVRANANALPLKGIDLTDVTTASVSSIGGQIGGLLDFGDPNWLQIEGLPTEPPRIDSLTFRVVEHDGFVYGGRSPHPPGLGDSPVWRMAPWTFEGLLAGSARLAFSDRVYDAEYFLPGRDTPVFEVSVDEGWAVFGAAGDVGTPPPPSYLWDMILEIGQIRLHDEGVAEGAGDVSFTLRDVSVGITAADVERTVRENLQSDPTAFLDLAEQILDASRGAPDIFYVHVPPSAAPEEAGDWLYFVTPMDIPLGDDGRREREYAYAHPAFFADPGLTRQVSSRTRVDGDEVHEKVRVDAGDRVYVEDDTGAVFVLEIGGKPSAHTISIEVRRVR